MLIQKEFDLLVLLAASPEFMPQRTIARKLDCSVGTVNKLLKKMTDCGFWDGRQITPEGLAALEPYRVKRAVFIAAGFGARLAPITLNTPKALVRVNGKRIIDTMLDAVVAAGIPEIVIVRGYLGEQFDQLLGKYPQIRFVDNPLFNESNNISSAMCVRFLLENAYVMDADLIIHNPGLIRRYEYRSNLLGVPVERTDDWCVTTDRNGYVDSVTFGGLNGYREVGIFYCDAQDGAKLAWDLQQVYDAPGGRERLWEHTPLIYAKQNYQITVRSCSQEDFTEIDTFSELKKIDRSYDL